jgi:CDP-glucose 4,6-dehydratase
MSEWLLELGAQVAGYSIDVPSQPSHFDTLKLSSRMKHVTGDVRELKPLQGLISEFKPEFVFHLAAQPLVRSSYDDPKMTFDTNVGGTVNVLEALRHAPSVRVALMITTDKVYENVEKDYAYRETDRLGGKDPYSASKACAEIACHAYFQSFFKGQSSLRMATARAGNVIGGGDWAVDRIVPDCVRAWAEHKPLMIRNPRSTRPWQHVLEPLSGYLWLGALLAGDEGTRLNGLAFNFGPLSDAQEPVSVLIDEMKKTWTQGSWKQDGAPPDHKKEAHLLQLNCELAKRELRWEGSFAFAEAVRVTAEWYQAYYQKGASAQELTSRQIRDYQALAAQRGRAWA